MGQALLLGSHVQLFLKEINKHVVLAPIINFYNVIHFFIGVEVLVSYHDNKLFFYKNKKWIFFPRRNRFSKRNAAYNVTS